MKRRKCLYLDMNLVAQHSSTENHGFGSSLELFAHMKRLLKCGAPLVDVPRIQNLRAGQSPSLSGFKQQKYLWQRFDVCSVFTLLWESIRALMRPSSMS